jgi:VanZ family protein
MHNRITILLDWILVIVFLTFIVLTLDIMPDLWSLISIIIGGQIQHMPEVFIGSAVATLLLYAVFIKCQRNPFAYLWFFVLAEAFYIVYSNIKSPYDRMHLYEYFILGFLFFRLLRHYAHTEKLYVLSCVLTMLVAVVDEYLQSFSAYRTPSISDLMADFSAALFGQLSIALVIKPRLAALSFKIKNKIKAYSDQEQAMAGRR